MITLPKIGDVITVTYRNDTSRSLVWRPAFTEYTGQVVPQAAWCSPNEFCITGNADFPVRTIRLNNVTKIVAASGIALSLAEIAPAVKQQWTVKGSNGNVYFVNHVGGSWTCTCLAGQHGRMCKHVNEAKQKI